MVRYLKRTCPRCRGHVGIMLREPEQSTRLQPVNGHCLRCNYRLAWFVIGGNRAWRSHIEGFDKLATRSACGQGYSTQRRTAGTP
jgi:hypothetical protein